MQNLTFLKSSEDRPNVCPPPPKQVQVCNLNLEVYNL